MNIAIIIAGGSGKRLKQDIPKQFICIDNKPILIYTMEAFENNSKIDTIVVVSIDGWQKMIWSYAKQFNINKLKDVVIGGNTRFTSILNGLRSIRAYASDDDIIMLHDANRPLIDDETINDSIEKSILFDYAISTSPCVDSMFIADSKYAIDNIDRNKLFMGKTPESAKYRLIVDVYKQAQNTDMENLPLSAILISQGKKVVMSNGSARNIKITTMEDIEIFRSLLTLKKYEWLK